jgi:hypothetical protein
MSELDNLLGYWKRLEGNMELREKHLADGGFICDGVCDKPFTEEDIAHNKEKVKSFREKSNKVAKFFKGQFDNEVIPYPTFENLVWNNELEVFEEPIIEEEPEE